MKTSCLVSVLLFTALTAGAQQVKTACGRVERFENFPSVYVQPRHIDVWLPDDYDPAKKYAVLYMQDGQMLFDASGTFNHLEWGVDETLCQLQQTGFTRPCIVVGIWNTGLQRHADYFPQKPFESLTKREKATISHALQQSNRSGKTTFAPQSDLYLKFLVTELKPFIDTRFSTERNRKSTFVAGSSMGGLISLYAICEYPLVFGGAACLSTHWPGIFRAENNPFPQAMLTYLEKHLPAPRTHRIYFDYGTETLDALYKPTQLLVDTLMKQKGYTGIDWITKEFPGQDHSEKAWASRLALPLEFLTTKFTYMPYDGNPVIWDGETYWGNIKSVEAVSCFVTDTPTVKKGHERKSVIQFNENWQVTAAWWIEDNRDTSTMPVPVYNDNGMPVLEKWIRKDGSLNSFSVHEYQLNQRRKSTEYSSYGTLSAVTEYEYRGDTTIAIRYSYNSDTQALDRDQPEKTVTIRANGNIQSSVTTRNYGIVAAGFTEYTAFDVYGNWTASTTTGEFLGEWIRLVTNRVITYYP